MIDKLWYIYTQGTLKPKPEDMKMKSNRESYLKKTSKIPKSIQIFFLIVHLMFGLDFGFGNLFSKKIMKLLKYYSAVVALTTFVIIIWPFAFVGDQVWYWCIIFECTVNFYIMKTTKYTLYNFLSDIHNADSIAILENESFGILTSMYALVLLLVKGFSVAIRCIFDYSINCVNLNPTHHAFYAAVGHAADLMPESQIIVRFYIYAYIKNMENYFNQDRDMNKFIERYDKIADYQDKIRRLPDNLVSINNLYQPKLPVDGNYNKELNTKKFLLLFQTLMVLLINIPKLMTTSWVMLDYIKKGVRSSFNKILHIV